MSTHKVVSLLLLVFVAVAIPVASDVLANYEQPYLQADGGAPPPPIPDWANNGAAT